MWPCGLFFTIPLPKGGRPNLLWVWSGSWRQVNRHRAWPVDNDHLKTRGGFHLLFNTPRQGDWCWIGVALFQQWGQWKRGWEVFSSLSASETYLIQLLKCVRFEQGFSHPQEPGGCSWEHSAGHLRPHHHHRPQHWQVGLSPWLIFSSSHRDAVKFSLVVVVTHFCVTGPALTTWAIPCTTMLEGSSRMPGNPLKRLL